MDGLDLPLPPPLPLPLPLTLTLPPVQRHLGTRGAIRSRETTVTKEWGDGHVIGGAADFVDLNDPRWQSS